MISFAQLTEDYQRELQAARISTWLRILKSPMSTDAEVAKALHELEKIAVSIWPGETI